MPVKLESKRFFDDMDWVDKNYTELQKKYKDKWVAVVNKEVICSGTNLQKVREEAAKKTGMNEIVLIFVECGSHIY